MNRRGFLKGLMAAGTTVALWEPTKLISIPSGKIFRGNGPFSIDKYGNITVNEVASQAKTTVLELHRWLQSMANDVPTGDSIIDILSPSPSTRVTDNIIELNEGYYVTNPQYLCEGSLQQKDEIWAGIKTVGHVEDTSIAFINGEPALRPGHVNQCVKLGNPQGDEVILTLKTPGKTYSRFNIDQPRQGVNVGALMEQPDLHWGNPYDDPAYQIYRESKTGAWSNHATTKGQRLAMKGKI